MLGLERVYPQDLFEFEGSYKDSLKGVYVTVSSAMGGGGCVAKTRHNS